MGKKKEPKLGPDNSQQDYGHEPPPSEEDEKTGQDSVAEKTQEGYENRSQNAPRLVKIESHVSWNNNPSWIDIKDLRK